MAYKTGSYNSRNYKSHAKPEGRSMHGSVKKEIQGLLDSFHAPEALDLVAKSMFKRNLGLPSDSWSAMNRLILLAHGSFDARGPKAWIAAGRRPEKGGYFFILAPNIIKKEKENVSTGEKEKKNIVIGFRPIMVWPAEKTSGDPIDYKIEEELPDFLGKEVAESWGIKITQGFENPHFFAYFSPTKKEICMATSSQQTFFHELMHAADEKVQKNLKNGQDADQEIVAEFGAAILMRMFGLRSNERHTYDYIDSYAKVAKKTAIDAVIPLINRLSKAINLILETSEKINNGAIA